MNASVHTNHQKPSLSYDDLTIERIEYIPLLMPLPKTYKGSYYKMTHRATILTRLYTKCGIVGECYNGDEYETQGEILKILRDEITPQVIGKSAFSPEQCWQAAVAPTYDCLRDRKLAVFAQASVDSAVWDAFGKAVGQPLHRIWGGAKQSLPIIGIGGYYVEGKKLADFGTEMEEFKSMGLGGAKFKVGGRTPKEDAERVKVARKAAGDDFKICVDANQGWDLRDAVEFGNLVSQYDIMWFEEPCRWYNEKRTMADVRRITGLRVAAGQSEWSRAGCRDLMMEGSIDVCNFDASWGAGPTEWMRVAGTAASFGVTMAHHEEPQVSAHLLGSILHSECLEVFHPNRDPLFYTIVANRSEFKNGRYQLPTGPGFGLELDEDAVKKYTVR